LVTTLESLADALPSASATSLEAGVRRPTTDIGERQKSLKSKPGVRKKREKMEREERERFGMNLAVLSQARQSDEANVEEKQQGGTSGRWAALRAHIEATLR
jgi:hypothetical protein